MDALQREHGLFAEGLQLLEAPAAREELRMPIELLERAILAEDSAKLGQSADPWWYFYEQFLSAYDPKLRKDCGRVLHACGGGPRPGDTGRRTASNTFRETPRLCR